MKPIVLGPWAGGMNNTAVASRIPFAPSRNGPAELRDACNVDIDDDGTVSRRQAWLLLDSSSAHSLFEHAGTAYGVVDGVLGRLDAGGFTALAVVPGAVAWCELNAEPVGAHYDGLFRIRDGVVELLPAAIKSDEASLMLAEMPGGQAVAAWNGRLLVARGNRLHVSEPLRYGVYDTLGGYVQFDDRITWLAALSSGVYVGLRKSVRWIGGEWPNDVSQRTVGGPSWRSAVLVVGNDVLPSDIQAEQAAIWMTPNGFALGLPGGQVVLPQSRRLKGIPMKEGRMALVGNRVICMGGA